MSMSESGSGGNESTTTDGAAAFLVGLQAISIEAEIIKITIFIWMDL